MTKGNGRKDIPTAGVNLIDPKVAGTTAAQKDYLERKDACLKDCSLIEKKYNIRLGAELRITPTGIMVVMVTYDMKGKKPPPRPN